MIDDVVAVLACPVCADDTGLSPVRPSAPAARSTGLTCARGHAFDVARQGYVDLTPGGARVSRAANADTAAMVEARETLLDKGLLAPLAAQLGNLVADAVPAYVLDAGAGTGHYLAAALVACGTARTARTAGDAGTAGTAGTAETARDADAARDAEAAGAGTAGIALDLSKPALRRAARAHPRIGAVAADVWSRLPIRTGTIDVVLDVFAPRNADEFARVLRPDGLLVVATPTPRHLAAIVEPLGLLSVDDRKPERLDRTLGARFEPGERSRVEYPVTLGREETLQVVAMGPSARHVQAYDLERRIAKLPEPIRAYVSVDITRWSPRPGADPAPRPPADRPARRRRGA